uniref:Gentian CONSTANS-like5 homolog n=1 Tax=Gentiana triflora TaxID=55190 RepID=A0A0K2SFT4_GENTR|nr:gentian CONSTANS-like5 homolog [Gentiana triflora]
MGFAESAATGGGGGGGGGWGLMMAKPCDYCNAAQALLFCRTDSTYMCMLCDTKIHNKLEKERHERVWMCEVCEQAPASLTCKADAATLCVTCDRDIHTANPLARRHERVPVVPFYDTAESVVKSTAGSTFLVPPLGSACGGACDGNGYVIEPEAGSDDKSIEFLFTDTDNNLDFDYPISLETRFQQQLSSVFDGVVPDQTIKPTVQPELPIPSSEKRLEIDFTKSFINPYSYTHSLTQSVSSSSMDIGVVPEGSTMSEMSYSFATTTASMDFNGGGNQATQLTGMDREARVLRYREKRKNRRFQKTIRYASRKAYAETRPRIKGRFAKRSDVDTVVEKVDSLFSPTDDDHDHDHESVSSFLLESRYGVVPSF